MQDIFYEKNVQSISKFTKEFYIFISQLQPMSLYDLDLLDLVLKMMNVKKI